MAGNRRRSCASGARLMSELLDKVVAAMSSLDFVAETYPMLTDWGVRDQDVLVHSLGCSAWTTLGQQLGFIAVCECPVPTSYSADIRSDSVWFSRGSRAPEVLIEFERYDGSSRGEQKLDDKVCNLLDAASRWEGLPKLLVLSAWSKGVISAPNTKKLAARCGMGFKTAAGVEIAPIRGTAVLFHRMIFNVQRDGELALTQSRCERLI